MKRFCDTDIWQQAWFRKLSPKLKCLYRYLNDRCNCIGLMQDFDPELATFQLGEEITQEDIDALGERVQRKHGGIWLPDFLTFQVPNVDWKCPTHRTIIKTLLAEGIEHPIANLPPNLAPNLGDRLQEKDKEQEEDQDKDSGKGVQGKGKPDATAPEFPATVAAAVVCVGSTVPEAYTTQIWHQLMARGCKDGTGTLVTRFDHYVKHRWAKDGPTWKPPRPDANPTPQEPLQLEPSTPNAKPSIHRDWKRKK